MRRSTGVVVLAGLALLLVAGCGSTTSGSSATTSTSVASNSGASVLDDSGSDSVFGDSAAITLVKDGRVKGCPSATLGEMADAFLSYPQWSDFESTTGNQVVELTGGISYKNMPADVTLQFVVDTITDDFEIKYMEIDDDPQSVVSISALISKMCEST